MAILKGTRAAHVPKQNRKHWSLSFLCLFSLLLTTGVSSGQSPTPTPSPSPAPAPDVQTQGVPAQGIWRCESSGGVCEVAIRSIVSVSSHEYIVDAVSRVVEVNIDTQGNMALRFYYIEPKTPSAPDGIGQSAFDRAKSLAKDIAGRTGMDDVTKRAAKNYPTTTHSHTIEYRLESEEEIKKVLASASAAFRTGAGSSIKVK